MDTGHLKSGNRDGLYHRGLDHDSCGIGFVADIKGRKSHQIVDQGLSVLANLTHRGAAGADPLAGDGAGMLLQLPDAFFRSEAATLGIDLPQPGAYAVGMVFLPQDPADRILCERLLAEVVAEEGQQLLGWRDVPVDSSCLGDSVRPIEPVIRQLFVGRGPDIAETDAFERKLFVIRKQAHIKVTMRSPELMNRGRFYVTSMSSRTITYKGMMLAANLAVYYKDLADERVESALALIHQRFSTNTSPSWRLAQPFRYLCHNGEINTVQGNINWMLARRQNMSSEIIGDDLEKLWPLVGDGASDSATFDNSLELLLAGGYSLGHAMMLMIPEAWADNPLMDSGRKAFYEYHAALMEPWDGPAAVAFTDGKQIGATLDRNGLRPARYFITDDDLVVLASEMGVLDIPEERIVKKWRLQPGKMLLIDLEQGRIIDDAELKDSLSGDKPYQQWLDETQVHIAELPPEVAAMGPDAKTLVNAQKAFGYTREDMEFFLKPMATEGKDPIGSMGRDTPPAVLSDRPKMLYDYFKQRFAQVTNPPIDPIREETVMSLVSLIGPRPNLLDLNTGGTHRRLEVTHPILTSVDLERVRRIQNHVDDAFRTRKLTMCYPASENAAGMEAALARLCERATETVHEGYNIIILTDRQLEVDRIAIPALLATAAVHHHLIKAGLRTEVGLVVETGEARQVHDFCLLGGYGAEAINPYLAFDSIHAIVDELPGRPSPKEAEQRYTHAVTKGMLKVMSKMGISTFQSYCGAQIFDAIGLSDAFVDRYFTGTPTAIAGVGLEEIATETVRRHAVAFRPHDIHVTGLDAGGDYAFRLRGEEHVWTPETISTLQHAVRSGDYKLFQKYTATVDDQTRKLKNLRGLFELDFLDEPIPLDEVEPAGEIVKRFATGAMSFGSISWEAHTTLAIAMNRLGAKSNTGEGGEEPSRYVPLPNGDSMRSAVKQIASGRFGVTTEYLVNADDIQIKMAQGAKPGEGGQLPGHKVNEWIAQVRHSTPGVGLISPPPHHDIYSIEDLKQLILDLKNVNPQARISVKLVSEVGVGTIAAGVAKAHADHVLISGDSGGTGASPLTSTMQAGSHWEIGLAETHQTLVENELRGRIAVQTDGGIRTGRDIVIAALLGADEVGFGTSALISEGCIMTRKCHLNTCPVGVATQDAELRKLFTGEPEHIVNFFTFLAEETREIMAKLGFRTYAEMIGQSDRVRIQDAITHWKAQGLDFSRVLFKPQPLPGVAISNIEEQQHALDRALDNALIVEAMPALDDQQTVSIETPVNNTNLAVGAMLSGEVARRYGHAGLPTDTIRIKLNGTAGQSFGAWLAHGVTLHLEGDANDYVGKGLSGGRIVIEAEPSGPSVARESIIIGNTVLYGAIAGDCYFNGGAGERFAVRNSGAIAVVERIGDHGCEYMTGGCVVVIGKSGRNFGAGMSGGIAYVIDEDGDFEQRVNHQMVELERVGRDLDSQFNGSDDPTLEELLADPLTNDMWRLKILIARHERLTNSSRAKEILDNFADHLPRFYKVVPIEYRQALERRTLTEGERLMGSPSGFQNIGLEDRGYQPVEERTKHYREFSIPLTDESVSRQGGRCIDCSIPYCHSGCPVDNTIPDWNDLVFRGNWREAIDALHLTNNFPEFTGRVCPAPCEEACTLNLQDAPVAIKTIEYSIIEKAWENRWVEPQIPSIHTDKRVAVIGSGPAGLAAAQQLARAGHRIDVFEKNAKIGGLLRYGIPDFKLAKSAIDRRMSQMQAEGVEFRVNSHVGVNVSMELVVNKYDAVVLAAGCEKPRDLPVPGRELDGVHFAMSFLTQQNRRIGGESLGEDQAITAEGKHVVVIGGGDTGSDCVGTSIRQGAASVTQLELLPRPPENPDKALIWPNWPTKLRTATSHDEGCERLWSVSTTAFEGTTGRVESLRGVNVNWSQHDGRWEMEEIAGSEFEIRADLVLLATGFVSPVHDGLVEQSGVELDRHGNVAADTNTYSTSVPGVYAAGDMRRGQSLVVWAIREGRKCAEAVDRYLRDPAS